MVRVYRRDRRDALEPEPAIMSDVVTRIVVVILVVVLASAFAVDVACLAISAVGLYHAVTDRACVHQPIGRE